MNSTPKTPAEHAADTGHARLARDISGRVVGQHDAEHLAAQGLHGWKLHEHHADAPMLLAREDYVAAVDAAREPVLCRDDRYHYVPHRAALSPHSPLSEPGRCPEPKHAEPKPAPRRLPLRAKE